jgi:hypothetical protein
MLVWPAAKICWYFVVAGQTSITSFLVHTILLAAFIGTFSRLYEFGLRRQRCYRAVWRTGRSLSDWSEYVAQSNLGFLSPVCQIKDTYLFEPLTLLDFCTILKFQSHSPISPHPPASLQANQLWNNTETAQNTQSHILFSIWSWTARIRIPLFCSVAD